MKRWRSATRGSSSVANFFSRSSRLRRLLADSSRRTRSAFKSSGMSAISVVISRAASRLPWLTSKRAIARSEVLRPCRASAFSVQSRSACRNPKRHSVKSGLMTARSFEPEASRSVSARSRSWVARVS